MTQDKQNIREQMGEIEHDQWLRWAGTVIKDLWEISSGHHVDCNCPSCKRIRRWKPNMIPYADLPDEIKEYDRKEADFHLNIKCTHGGVCPECKGDGRVFNPEVWGGKFDCPTCKGAGHTIETKEVKEIIKEWEG